MKQTLAFLFLLGFSFTLWSQQPAQYSLYMLNKFNWNPAYAGLDNSLSFTGVYRKQWVALEGSPASQNLNLHLPVYFLGGGLGLQFENDVFGPEKWTSATLAYSHHLALSNNSLLAVGFSGGLAQREIDGDQLRTPGGNYSNGLEHNDPILPLSAENAMVPTFNAGLYFQSEVFEAGFSIRHLSQPSVEFSTFNLALVRNYFFTAGANLELGRRFTVHPSIMVQSDATQTQIDFSTLIRYDEKFFTGASLRGYNPNSIDAAAIIFGFQISEKTSFAYAYDLTLSDIKSVSNGSHELLIHYNLNKPIGKGRPPKIIYNPRSL